MNPIILVLGLLGLDAIIILVLVHVITYIINNYIGTDKSPRFIKLLAAIGGVEVIVSFAIAYYVKNIAAPYLFQLPNEGFYEGFWIVLICVIIILTLLTTLLALAYYLGYKYGYELARERYEISYS